jgi:uncharacterized membrane protein YjgN (DUF898 family)
MTAQSALGAALSADAPRPAAEQPLPRIEKFTFTGSGSEYFRIWIVNLLLTIITLGIYSAWAKVRKLRYFYGSARLAGSGFEYHGDPVAILKGRLIAAALFIVYTIISEYSITAQLVMLIPLALAFPWLIWKSLQFTLYYSSYRGIRFGFRGSAGQAYWQYLGLPILTGLTLGLLTPFTHQRNKQFQHSESRFGATYFSFDGRVGAFYGAYLRTFLTTLVAFALLGVIAGMMAGGGFGAMGTATVLALVVGTYLVILLVVPVFMTQIQNLIWNNTRIKGHQFTCDMTWGQTAFIMATNLLGILFTLGLYTPFAQIRMLKYRMESMTLVPAGSLNEFVAGEKANPSATGEGAADLMDFDLSL